VQNPWIRPATPDDAAELAELFWRVRSEAVPDIPMVVHPRESVLPFVRNVLLAEFEVHVAQADGRLVGFIALMPPDLVGHLYIDSAHTGKGLGSRFLGLARTRFPHGLQLYAFQSNRRAIRFYERHGFEQVAWSEDDNEEGAPDVLLRWGPRVAGTVAAYDRDARTYAAGLGELTPHLVALLDRFAAALPRPAHVLEVGSGPGRDADALEARGIRVRRTDIARGFVDLVRAQGHEADVLDPLHDDLGGPYDGVYASASLLHVPREDLGTVLRRLGEATVPGGTLHLDVKEGDGDGWSTHGHVSAPRHFTYWREGPLRAELAGAGWSVVHLGHTTGGRDDWIDVLARRD
jgi:ribosomal protein S18 acetylase RimI-like enzyme